MISAVVLSHNDQQILEKTIKSLTWCDEVIVVDDYSTDGTVALAKKLGVNVYQRHLSGDFAAQRNFGLSQAKGEWVLYVDSDEIVSESLQKEIQRPIANNSSPVGYFLKREDSLYGHVLKHGETGSVRLLRLAKKSVGKWVRPVHEVWEVEGETGELTHPLLHYPHPSVAEFLEDINTYSTLNAEYLYSQKIKEPGWYIPVYPVGKFLRNYVLLLGFLDGTPGAIIAIMMSFHSFLTRAKLYMLWRNTAKESK